MTALDILQTLPEFTSATADTILRNPAWALPVTWPAAGASLRCDAVRPAETLGIAIRFEDEPQLLALADSPAFPGLHKVFGSRSEIPQPLLLALVEKEVAPLFQLLENVARRQLSVAGFTDADDPRAAEAHAFRIVSPDGATVATFLLTLPAQLLHTLGDLRLLDPAHPEIAGHPLEAEIEYAAFSLSDEELAGLSEGDCLLLPELAEPGAGRLVLPGTGAAGMLRVIDAAPYATTIGDLASGTPPALPPPKGLRLVRDGVTLAFGRLDRVGDQHAFAVETVPGRA